MLYRVAILTLAAVAGVGLAFYSLYVEAMTTTTTRSRGCHDDPFQIHSIPGYQAACDISSWSSCSKVFTSFYSRILVHWGLAEPGGHLDLSLPMLALPYFMLILSYPGMRRNGLSTRRVYLAIGCVAALFNVYLAMVLKFVLQEFCVVCFGNYIVNAIIFVCLVIDTKAACGPKVKKV